MTRHAARALAAAGLALSLALTGCAEVDPEAQLQGSLNDMIAAANARDAAGLRAAVDGFVDVVRDQGRRGELTSPEVEKLQALAAAVRSDANLIDQALLDTQRRMREDAERKKQEEQAREEERKRAEEEQRRLEEERKKQEEEQKKREEEEKKDDDDGGVSASLGPSEPSPSPTPS